ncbi:erythromycin esterase family protein [Planomicrobium sp. CPCC 101110]|uniref:erythromycin esterase family protein n=1 Tax=Planomicrobium sp. CPCC 101110 TaxID=2599619 RepID=UPI0011B66F27|nr:erythromycin esterase family protein [Planomicrobium sp. CPCC 101110]TWT24776.1 erythromycin esterase family protein [Planomicrobium sp. CPCC 101110]
MSQPLEEAVKKYAQPFQSPQDLTAVLDAIGDAKIVMLGEASHGTSEFYTVRAELSKRLIQEKGFTLIAVEGDWPSSQQVNRYIRGYSGSGKSAEEVLQSYRRWPTWMWANEEIADFTRWLKKYNENTERQVGFYGIDVYSLWESMEEVVQYLTVANPAGGDLDLAKKAFSCFEPFNRQPEKYAISTANFTEVCVDEVSKLLSSIRSNEEHYKDDQESGLNLEINALVAKNAEDYYRAMVQSGEISWNIRDEHMVEAINEVCDYHGRDAKIIIWEHNTHIGDARATDMKRDGMLNVGQVLREQNRSQDVFAVGFGTYQGTVIAADSWGAPHERISVPPARINSWEEIMHRSGAYDKLLIFNEENRPLFEDWVGHRAIGVVYNPEFEAYGNYVPSKISQRYDAFIFLDETKALSPLKVENPIID